MNLFHNLTRQSGCKERVYKKEDAGATIPNQGSREPYNRKKSSCAQRCYAVISIPHLQGELPFADRIIHHRLFGGRKNFGLA